jgi:hypothetical protein
MKRFALLFALILGTPHFAVAEVRDTLFQLQHSITERVTEVIRRADPQAIVSVRLVPESAEKPLPMTPFTVKDVTLENDSSPIKLDFVQITIYSRQKELGEGVRPVILNAVRSLAQDDAVNTTIQMQPLPQSLVPADILAQEKEKAAEGQDNGLLKDSTKKQTPTYLVVAATVALILALYSIGAILFLGFRALYRTMTTVAQSFKGAIEGLSEASSRAQTIATTPPPMRNNVANEVSGNSRSRFDGISAEALSSILWDCYWGQFDGYAFQVWRSIGLEMKRQTLALSPDLGDYIEYLINTGSELEAEDSMAEHEPQYLAPLPIQHIDNSDLTEMIRKNSSLFFALPKLRREGLTLTVAERISLSGTTRKSGPINIEEFKRMPRSKKRELAASVGALKIRSIQEELEALNFCWSSPEPISVDVKSKIVSLGWLLELPEQMAIEIFRSFSAKELASAWTGPDEVLKRLEVLIPEKKRELIQSYLSQTKPTRESRAFTALHSAAIQRLTQLSKGTQQDENGSDTAIAA